VTHHTGANSRHCALEAAEHVKELVLPYQFAWGCVIVLKTCDTRAENISTSLHSHFLKSTIPLTTLLSPKLNLRISTITKMEWSKKQYNQQYENWYPWVEDNVLYYFTKDNKASYATKGVSTSHNTPDYHTNRIIIDQLSKTKITGNEQVDNVQDGVNNLVGGQVGQGGLLQPVGDHVSKEGINRAERGGKDGNGSYAGAMGDSASAGASKVSEGAKGAGSYVGSFFGGKKDEKK
jgi:hypothetical protein